MKAKHTYSSSCDWRSGLNVNVTLQVSPSSTKSPTSIPTDESLIMSVLFSHIIIGVFTDVTIHCKVYILPISCDPVAVIDIGKGLTVSGMRGERERKINGNHE